MADEPSIGNRTMHGMAWAYGSFVGGRAITLGATAILARLLDPRDFGLVALALVITALLETVADIGVGQALVVAPEDTLWGRADTAFNTSVVLGVGLGALVAASGPLMAAVFHENELSWMMGLFGINFVLRGISSTHYALAERQIDFRTRTRAEMADVLTRGVVSIALALAGLGAASIVLGYLAGTAALSATLWLLVEWRPRPRRPRQGLRELVRLGAGYSGVDAISAISANVDYVFIGRALGPASLGLYSIGFRVPDLLIMNLSLVAGRVLFPAFAAVTPERRADAFLATLRYTMMLAAPLAAGIAALAQPIVSGLFGPKWEGSVEAMQVLTLYSLFRTVNIPAGTVYKASGRPQILLAIGLPRLVVLVVSIALVVDRGIVAVAACQAGAAALVAVFSTVLAARLLAVPLVALLDELWAPLLAATIMFAALVGVERALPTWPALVVGVVVGAALYIGVIWTVRRDALMQIWNRLHPPRGSHQFANS